MNEGRNIIADEINSNKSWFWSQEVDKIKQIRSNFWEYRYNIRLWLALPNFINWIEENEQENTKQLMQGKMVWDTFISISASIGAEWLLIWRNYQVLPSIQQVFPDSVREQKRLENIRPVINLDGRCYTPLFIL